MLPSASESSSRLGVFHEKSISFSNKYANILKKDHLAEKSTSLSKDNLLYFPHLHTTDASKPGKGARNPVGVSSLLITQFGSPRHSRYTKEFLGGMVNLKNVELAKFSE